MIHWEGDKAKYIEQHIEALQEKAWEIYTNGVDCLEELLTKIKAFSFDLMPTTVNAVLEECYDEWNENAEPRDTWRDYDSA